MKRFWVLGLAVMALALGCGNESGEQSDNYCNYSELSNLYGSMEWCEGNTLTFCNYDNKKRVRRNCEDEGMICYKTSSGNSRCIEDELGQACDSEYDWIKCSGDRMIKCENGVWNLFKDCQTDNKTCVNYSGINNARCEEACDFKEVFMNQIPGETGDGKRYTRCSQDHGIVAEFYCGSASDGTIGYYYVFDKEIKTCPEGEICEDGKCVSSESCNYDKCVDNVVYSCVAGSYQFINECFPDEVCKVDEESKYASCVSNRGNQ